MRMILNVLGQQDQNDTAFITEKATKEYLFGKLRTDREKIHF
jgi:hypothetical protein